MATFVTAVAENPNKDGSHSILVDHSGEQIEVSIPLQHLQELIKTFQIAAVDRASEMNRNMQVPKLNVERIDIAHQAANCELMVSTTQTGVTVLLMDMEQLHQMKHEIDRVIAYRVGSGVRH